MMIFNRLKRPVIMILAVSILAMTLTGCWDSRELEKQLILTGLAMDVSDKPGQISVTAQVVNTSQADGSAKSGANGGTTSGGATIEMKAEGTSLMDCLNEIDRDSDHKLLVHHNQIRLFGIDLAKQGIKRPLDSIMRDPKARLEVPLVVIDGRGGDALTAKLSPTPISGVYLGSMLEDMAGVSYQYRVRLIDFVKRLQDDNAAPVIPIMKVIGEEDNQQIKQDGMAVFRDDKMIGRLTNQETLGYIWSFGDVNKTALEVTEGSSSAAFIIQVLDCVRDISLEQDSSVRVSLKINAVIEPSEIYGFDKMTPAELLPHLEELSQQEIKDRITGCLLTAQNLNADIFGFCTMMQKKYPKEWDKIRDEWNSVFSNIELDIQAEVRIPRTGQIVQSLEMEENNNENR